MVEHQINKRVEGSANKVYMSVWYSNIGQLA